MERGKDQLQIALKSEIAMINRFLADLFDSAQQNGMIPPGRSSFTIPLDGPIEHMVNPPDEASYTATVRKYAGEDYSITYKSHEIRYRLKPGILGLRKLQESDYVPNTGINEREFRLADGEEIIHFSEPVYGIGSSAPAIVRELRVSYLDTIRPTQQPEINSTRNPGEVMKEVPFVKTLITKAMERVQAPKPGAT